MPSSESSSSITPIAVAVVRRGEQYLVGRRAPGKELAGYLEFPGGKVLPGEMPRDAAVRECFEETGLQVEVLEQIAIVDHDYPHGRLRIWFFLCAAPEDNAASPQVPFHWQLKADLTVAMFPAANAQVLERLGFRAC